MESVLESVEKCLAGGNHRAAAINSCWWPKRAADTPSSVLQLHPAAPPGQTLRFQLQRAKNLLLLHLYTHQHTHTHNNTHSKRSVSKVKIIFIYSIVSKILRNINITKLNTFCV